MNLVSIICIIGLFCSPIINSIGNQASGVTFNPVGLTQQILPEYGYIFAAHSDLVGREFYRIHLGDVITVWSDDVAEVFVVTDVGIYGASPVQVWMLYEIQAQHLMLITCAGNGRLIISAKPYIKDLIKVQ